MGLITRLKPFLLSYLSPLYRSYILSILSILSDLKYSHINITIKDDSSSETLSFGPSSKANPEEPEVSLTVKSHDVWTRLCLYLDLVCSPPLSTIFQLLNGGFTGIRRILRAHNPRMLQPQLSSRHLYPQPHHPRSGVFLLQIFSRIQRLLFNP